MKTQSCVTASKKTVAVTEQTIDQSNNGTLVQITRDGICGSDLYYYQKGKVGNFVVRASMVLGHEVIGKIIHSNSSELHGGQTVAINPFRPYGHYKYCVEHNENQCIEMYFFGNTMYFPRVDGGPARYKMIGTPQCAPYPAKADEKAIAFTEPLAVAIHATHQIGKLQGKRVFTSSVGPIGCLIASAVKTLGAAEIVCADVSPCPLSLSREMGADVLVDPQNDDIDRWKAEKGYLDVSFEVSDHPSSVNTCLEVTRAHGVVVQVGMGGAMAEFPMMTSTGKEILPKGPLHSISEFNTAVSWLANSVINPLPLLSAEYPFTDLEEAPYFVGDRIQAARVQLIF